MDELRSCSSTFHIGDRTVSPYSAIGNVNYGRNTRVPIPERCSELIHISRTFYGHDVTAGTVKGVFLADELGRFFVVIHFKKDAHTPGSPSIICLQVGTHRMDITELGALGHTVEVFVDDKRTQSLKAVVYPEILHGIGQMLLKEQDGLHNLPNAKGFTDPRSLTVLGIDAPLARGAFVYGLDKGTERY